MAETVLAALRRINRGIAYLVGGLLAACALFILIDIVLRQVGSSFGGTDEISGYVMAIATSWGMAYTLTELGHVRIDLLRSRFRGMLRASFDLLAMLCLVLTVSVIAWYCWPVVEGSLRNASRANTPLETPLAWVQLPWLAGWVWFALSSWATVLAAGALLLAGRFDAAERAIGAFPEEEAVS